MKSKWIKKVTVGSLLSALPLVSSFAGESPQPNVIFIYADDMGYGEIEALNPDRCKVPTPSLNQLAAEGMTFTDAHTTSSVCSPSRYGLLTGRYNWRTRLQSGVLKGGKPCLIAPDRKTLGTLFREQGYSTAIVGKWHLDYQYEVPDALKNVARSKKTKLRFPARFPVGTHISDGPVTHGFDTFYGYHHGGSMSSIVQNDTIVKEVDITQVLPLLTEEVVRQIDQKAASAKAGKPFFIYFPMSSPHTPIVPAPEWIGKTALGPYGDFVAQTDGSVGAVLAALERNGLSENTIVIFSADNGSSRAAGFPELQARGHYSSANLRGSKADLWEGGHRVPFILRWPAHVKANSQCNQMISLADMMATFADLFSVKFDDQTAEDSFSFLPAIVGKAVPDPRQMVVHHSIRGRFAIRQGDWKLLLAPGSGGWSAPNDLAAIKQGLPEMQLYNVKDDPGETTNLITQHPEKVATLIALLESTVANGRSTLGAPQSNDVKVDIWKKELNQPKPKSSKRKK